MRLKVSNVCQLVDPKYIHTIVDRGVTFTSNGDGSITVNGTPTGEYYSVGTIALNIESIKPNHKYVVYDINKDPIISELIIANYQGGYIFEGIGDIFTFPEHPYTRFVFEIRVNLNQTANNIVVRPQLFDLTEMYGIGNEPTTVAQFRQDFPNEMYEYSPVCWKKFSRLKYVTETKNLFKFSNEVGTLTGDYGPNAARNFEEDKWYIGFTPNNYYIPNNIEKFYIKDNLIYLKRKDNTSGYGLARAFRCESNKTYTVSCGAVFTEVPNCIFTSYFDKDGNLLSFNNAVAATKTITTPANCSWLVLIFTFFNATNPSLPGETYIINPQLELGSTATPYQPYGYLPLNRGKYIANKQPVQLLDKSKFYKTSVDYGVTWTNNGDGTITANGTATNIATYTLLVPNPRVIPGHKYLFISSITPQQADVATIITNIGGESGNGFIFTTDLTHINIYFYVRTNVTVSNVVFKPQLFDLTEMYGAGNEPTTVAQFRADYPNELYDYNPYNAITFR